MILSLRHRFVFVRARKVAGTSVEMVLSTMCGEDDIVPPMMAVDERQRQALGGFSCVISFLHMRRHFDAYRAGGGMPDEAVGLSEELDKMRATGGIPRLKSLAIYSGRQPELLRYESLERDVAAFGESLGVTLPPLPHAKRGALSDTLDPRHRRS